MVKKRISPRFNVFSYCNKNNRFNFKKTANFVLFGVVFQISGCAQSSGLNSYITAPTVDHKYSVLAVDAKNNPVSGVEVKVNLSSSNENSFSKKIVSCITNDQGYCPVINYEVSRDQSSGNIENYASEAKATGVKEGYYAVTASGYSNAGLKFGSKAPVELKVTMVRPIDYLEDSFAVSVADRELRERIMRALEIIKSQSSIVNSELVMKGIGVSEFKSKKYFKIRVNSTIVFNSLKIDKYEMGKRIFDETVRKLLSPLNDHVSMQKNYYGYDIVVYGNTKNFIDKGVGTESVEYRFLMPESAVRKYKEKDISGQALLDASVQLMDDERVEIRLQ